MHTILSLSLHLNATLTPPKYTFRSLGLHVKVQYQELRLLCAVPASDGTHQFGFIGTNTPHHATTPTAVQSNQIADELTYHT